MNMKQNTMTDENPGLLTRYTEVIRDHIKTLGHPYEWECVYFNGREATFKDTTGKCWDFDTKTLKIWEA